MNHRLLTPLPEATGVRSWHSASSRPPPFRSCLREPRGGGSKFLGICRLLVASRGAEGVE